MLKENNSKILFHGSKKGFNIVTPKGSRSSCDFGQGFYLGKTYDQTLSFVSEYENSSVYAFSCSFEGLKIKEFDCDLEWMLAICYYRGTIDNYKHSEMIKRIIDEVEKADIIIAPIADNKMFYIMAQFVDGEINSNVALHSLSASKLGLQYVFKSDKAINKLNVLQRFYISKSEREENKVKLTEMGYEVDTKLKLAKREFKDGLYIEEIIK